jgi:hypothetical protein
LGISHGKSPWKIHGELFCHEKWWISPKQCHLKTGLFNVVYADYATHPMGKTVGMLL